VKRKRRSVGFIAFAVFVAYVLIGGYALNAAGYDDNPFSQISFLTSSMGAGNGDGHFQHGDFQGNPGGQAFGQPPAATTDTNVNLTGQSSSASQFQLPPLNDSSGSAGGTSTSQFQLPPLSNSSGSDASTASSPDANNFAGPPNGQAFNGPDDQNSISWSDFGDVLYDLWFICAVTAVFIVVQWVFKFSLKQLKRRLPRAATAQ